MRPTALLLSLLLPLQVCAEGMKYVPKWHMVNQEACYSFEEAKKLVEIDFQLDVLIQQDPVYRDMIKDLRETNDRYVLALAADKAAVRTLTDSNKALNDQLVVAVTRANHAEATTRPSIGWLVAGGVVLVAAGAVAGVIVAKNYLK